MPDPHPRFPAPALMLALTVILSPAGASTVVPATPDGLAAAMQTRRSVLLGEVHDNAAQHALRAAALRRLVESGARPALAFEQFDRDQQDKIDRLRREQRDADALIEAAGARSWKWALYRPFLQLALEYDLPIVAANLSRTDAMKVSTQGWNALFNAGEQAALGLNRLPAEFVAAHERAVARGHCDLLPADALPPMARAQIARDIVLAHSLRPFLERGVVLLSGNGHVRKDIGVPFWLRPDERLALLSISLLEIDADDDESSDAELSRRYDAVVRTAAAERSDPCEPLRKRLQAPARQ
jgi:uncharacterized iron-regulated protein